MKWWDGIWGRKRNLPQQIRRLGYPNFALLTRAMGDMLDRDRTSNTERDQLLNQALELLKQVVRMDAS